MNKTSCAPRGRRAGWRLGIWAGYHPAAEKYARAARVLEIRRGHRPDTQWQRGEKLGRSGSKSALAIVEQQSRLVDRSAGRRSDSGFGHQQVEVTIAIDIESDNRAVGDLHGLTEQVVPIGEKFSRSEERRVGEE